MTTYISIIIAIIAFSLIVLVHELGHMMAAKKNGIFVEEFAIGMGPKLLSKQYGETLYSIRAFPIGGFCKMCGDDEESDDPRSFNQKSVPARIVVIVAGALMNFIFGIIIIFALVLAQGYATTVIGNAPPELPAYAAGIKQGDKILSVNEKPVHVFEDIRFYMNFIDGGPVTIEAESDGVIKTFKIIPEKQVSELEGETYTRYILGVEPVQYSGFLSSDSAFEKAPLAGSIINALDTFGFYVRVTFESLSMLVTGEISIKELSGFLGIGNAFVDSIKTPIDTAMVEGVAIPFGDRLKAAVLNVMSITVLITINLGIMNLLPLPALDGGRAVFLLIEGIRRKPIDREREGMIHFAGLVLLMLLMVFVTYNDVLRLFA